jgi:hypothetical protein
MTPPTMDTVDTTRTLLLTVRCESMICGLPACIGFILLVLSSYRLKQLHLSLVTIECQRLTLIGKRRMQFNLNYRFMYYGRGCQWSMNILRHKDRKTTLGHDDPRLWAIIKKTRDPCPHRTDL